MLAQLKALNIDRLADLDEAIALATWGRATLNGFAHYKIEPPAWLADKLEALDEEIQRKRRDILKGRRQEIESSLAALQTVSEKRAALQAQLAKVNDALG